MTILAIGDIHTKTWIIDAVRNIIDNYDEVVFVGDYADDWGKPPLDTIKTWKALKKLQEDYPSKVNLVLGNHDYIYVRDTPSESGGYNHVTQLILNSAENKKLKKWLSNLPISLEIDGVTYSHAGYTEYFHQKDVIEDKPQPLWDDLSPIWARPGNQLYADFPQVFGHTPSDTCWEVQKNIWCIDTFSNYSNGTPKGDYTVLEIINGKQFNKIKLVD